MSSEATVDDATAALKLLSEAGLRLRTRALTTTLFSRLCLCDLFVHGIGGAKYDAMTDRIASRFFGVGLPEYLTLSATEWLAIGEPHSATASDVSRLRQMLREIQQNPQRHVGPNIPAAAQALVAEKALLIAEQNAGRNTEATRETSSNGQSGQRRYRRFPEINRELARQTEHQRRLIREELTHVEQRVAANRTLMSREFSFCLFSDSTIQSMINRLRSDFSLIE
jgi:hypothetical protein